MTPRHAVVATGTLLSMDDDVRKFLVETATL